MEDQCLIYCTILLSFIFIKATKLELDAVFTSVSLHIV